MKKSRIIPVLLAAGMLTLGSQPVSAQEKAPVDYVNPYIGNISHLLVPTFPTVQLPNSMLRVYPERADYTSEYISGLPIIVTDHRERSAFKLIPEQGNQVAVAASYTYDNEHLTPYSFDIDFSDNEMSARYAVSHQSAIYEIAYRGGQAANVVLTTQNGTVRAGKNWMSGSQLVSGETRVYVYVETEEQPVQAGVVGGGTITAASEVSGENVGVALRFADGVKTVHLRYGVSYISEEQAQKNLRRELSDYDVRALAAKSRQLWNETLGRIQVTGGTEDEKTVLYSSYYRTFERPLCLSEDGRYWSAFDNQVHEDGGVPFYNDDWIWDTYRAAHPLRAITDQPLEENILKSFLRMSEQNGTGWIPTFPEVNGDSRRMNSNHTTATFADALAHGLDVDYAQAYEACKKCIEEKSLAPWSGESKAGWIDQFYKEHGYIPAINMGEEETDPNVNKFEKRQPIAVTLGTAYDQWCLYRMADWLSKHTKNKKQAKQYAEEAAHYLQCAHNYRNVYNDKTGFFHPKDKDGHFIEPFDYAFPGGMGAREFYGENNGWVYRWDVQHNVSDLIALMGGNARFIQNLDQTFAEPLGRSKYEFYAKLPDHTGNVGQFSMANEPSLHIPYLYNYAGAPWKAQKRIRQMLKTWFRNDLMGVPGDEDGGGLTSFVVLSSLGFYPVTPGLDAYNIGSPLFTDAKVRLSNGNTFEIKAPNASDDNKYIQSAVLNGKEWNQPWFTYDDIKDGAVLELVMGSQPNKAWGAAGNAAPPSADVLTAGTTTRIACSGASITEGYGVSDRPTKSYPGQLGALLGGAYQVMNFGRGGATMLRKGDCPFVDKETYQPSMQSEPDIVLIDLGGNDAKLRNRIHKADFVEDARSLVSAYQQLPTHPRVILMTAIPGFTNDSTEIWDKAIVRDINPLIIEAARQMNLEVIDMHPVLENRNDLLKDDIHPDDEGARLMAEKLAWYLRTYPRKPSSKGTVDGKPIRKR